MRTPKNILQHELIGLECKVVAASNPSQIGLSGRVIDETMKTLVISTHKKRSRIPKMGTKFRFKLNETTVEVNGDALIGKPEDRIKRKQRRF
jgi:ribonuclease P protein subunit POP4